MRAKTTTPTHSTIRWWRTASAVVSSWSAKIYASLWKKKQPNKPCGEAYIDDVGDDPRLKDKNVVAIDPNMSDLLCCVDSDANDQVKFRYTQSTRRKETKVKKHRNILQQRKEEYKVEDKMVQQWEAEPSEHNRKTMNFDHFKAYVKKKWSER